MSFKLIMTDYVRCFARLGAALLAVLAAAAALLGMTEGWHELTAPHYLRLALGLVIVAPVGASFMTLERALDRNQQARVR